MEIKIINVRYQVQKRLAKLIMKAFFFLLSTVVLGFTPSASFSQAKIIIDADKKVTIHEVFRIIKNQTEYRFIYPENLFENAPDVKLKKGSISLDKLLIHSLSNDNFIFKLEGNNIVITKENNKKEPKIEKQQTKISGQVSDHTGMPLIGVNIIIKGTSRGTQTDFDGNFTIDLKDDNAILVVSYIGYTTKEVIVDNEDNIKITLEESATGLKEVVVTALGIKRENKSLGYSVQELKGKSISETPASSLLNSISGKVSGVQITSSNGAPGSSTRIQIRGASSIGSTNEPLFVVDGVPIDNGNYSSGSTDYGNGASAINSDDIESMSILKGPAASSIYGSRGANGVVLITTKTGKGIKGLGIEVNSTTTFERPFRISNYQNEYGQGTRGEFAFVDGKGGGINDGVDESWGPRLDGRLIPQFDSPVDENGKIIPTPWIAHPNNVKDFYELGQSFINNIAIVGSDEKADFRLSFNNMDIKGIMPNNDYKKTSIALNTGYKISDRVSVRATANYIKDGSDNRSNAGAAFTWFGRQVDISKLRNYILPGETDQFNWNYNYSSNPYYVAYESTKANEKDRLLGNISFDIKLTSWLNLLARSGMDFFNDKRKSKGARFNANRFGSYSEEQIFVRETNSDILFSTKNFELGKFAISGSIGGNRRFNYYQRNFAHAGELSVNGIYNLRNSRLPVDAQNYFSKKAVNSLYATGQFSYNNYLFLEVSARNDWSSTLKKGNNSYFYPGASLSFILTEALENRSEWLSYIKLRAGAARVGNDTEPYKLRQTYTFQQGWGVIPMVTGNRTMLSSELKPELTTSYEVGSDFRFANGRIKLDLTYYSQSTTNQILNANISNATGYESAMINAGKIRNTGIEISFSGTPIKNVNGFQWETFINYSKNKNKVIELTDGLTNYQLGTYQNMSIEARVGQPYGTFFGSQYLRAPDGQIIYSNGLPQTSSEKRILGSFVPDWLGGFGNTFSYKNFSLYTLIDVKWGGNIFSYTVMGGRYSGVLAETVKGREEGIIGEGVKNIGTNQNPEFVPNDIRVSSEDWHHSYYFYNNNEASVFDASYVKLREVKFGYNLPSKFLDKTPFNKINISAVGRNLALLYSKVPHIDPETSSFGSASNVQGIESGQTMSSRSLGLSVNFSF